MKHFSQQLNKKATTTVKLQAAERRELKERLVAYMEYHPLPAELKAKSVVKPAKEALKTEPFTVIRLPFANLFKYSAVAAAVVLVVVPFMAERAVPGDTLYAVKVQFNEELRSTFTFDSYQKVEWETERLNRRIAEARLLASEGRLTEEVEVEVAEAVRTHTENAKREIESLREKDADGAAIASIELDTTLEVQSTSLRSEEEGEAVEGEDQVGKLIMIAIDASRDTSAQPTATSTPPAYEKLMARVEQNTTRIYALRENLREVASAEELAEVTRRAEDVDRSIKEAMDLAKTEDMEARQALVAVLQRTQRLIVFMTELEVTKTVDLESIVPVVLTAEEKAASIEAATKDLEEKMMQIDEMVARLEDEAILEKVDLARATITELSVKMETLTSDHKTFMVVASEALTLAQDVIILLEQQLQPVGIELPETEVGDKATGTSATSSNVIEDKGTTTEPANLHGSAARGTTTDFEGDLFMSEVDNAS